MKYSEEPEKKEVRLNFRGHSSRHNRLMARLIEEEETQEAATRIYQTNSKMRECNMLS
jgi:hypothetical protein